MRKKKPGNKKRSRKVQGALRKPAIGSTKKSQVISDKSSIEGRIVMKDTVAKPEAGTEDKNTVEAFSALVLRMGRLMNRIGMLKPLSDAHLGLAEWSVMLLVSENEGITNRLIAKRLEIRRKNVNKICDTLGKAELVNSAKSSEDESDNSISLTLAGKALLSQIAGQLMPLIESRLDEKGGVFDRVERNLKPLFRLTRTDEELKRAEAAASS
jgi:DNA-binding MarR family transcriptional regulator